VRQPAPRHNLPLQLTSFVGREQALAEVGRLLATTRLLTLTGAPGVGKTRLALQLAGEGREAYADGVWLVELAPLADPALVPQAVATAVGVREQPGRRLVDTLADAVRGQELLLVLDNCEHLVEACATLADRLLRAGPRLRVLATSREALGIAGETTWWVAPLALPAAEPMAAAGSERLAALEANEAVQLFVERARAAQPAFALTERNAGAVGQVCRRLDGIPLALELAAVRVPALGVEQLAQRLDDRFRLLTGGRRTALPRQQTLRAAVDWSYTLLPEAERVLLRRLAVFAGGWTLAAAEGVCGGDGLEAVDVFPLLVDLVDKSLVVAEPEDAEPRYRLLETLRQYGGERLREAGEEAAVRTRHLEWYDAFADGTELRLRGSDQMVWLARTEREHDNIRAALAWSQGTPDTAEVGLHLAGEMWPFWYMRSHYSEWRRWLDGTVALRGEAPGAVLFGAAGLAMARAEYETAEALLKETLVRCRERGDRWHTAAALLGLGRLEYIRGNYERSVALTEECLALLREAGEKFAIAIALGGLGLVAQAQGDYARAGGIYEEGLALFRAQGDKHGAAWSLHYLGLVAQAQGDSARAGALYREGLALRWELGDKAGTAQCLEGLAAVAGAQNQTERAARLFGAAATLRDTLGTVFSPRDRADHEHDLAALRTQLGEQPFAAAWSEGRALPLEEAIDYALVDAAFTAAPATPPVERPAVGQPMLLSRRELEVAALLAQGLTNRQIAEELVISEWTADSHVRHILSKLGVRSRAQIAAWASEQGLLRPEVG
jgi:non-specific serine/threonine protein kinase